MSETDAVPSGGAGADAAPAWTGSVWLRGWRGALLLVTLCLAVYLPGFAGVPVVDRDEARFAQASRQMLESGDFVVPRVQDRPRLNKPPLIYWMQSASVWVLTGGDVQRDAIWMYRVPSLIAAVVIVLATGRLGTAMCGGVVGFLAGAIVGASPLLFWESHQARSDMVLVAWTAVAVLALWKCWGAPVGDNGEGRGWFWPLALWVAVGGGVMTKGPITPMVIVLGVLALGGVTGEWRGLVRRVRPVLGIVVVAAMGLPWVFLVTREVGLDRYVRTIVDETLGRSVGAQEGHSGVFGYHTLLLPVLLFPGSLGIGLGLWGTWRAAREGGQKFSRAAVFLLCIVVPSWLVFEFVSTKLPHYTLPLYPILAIIAGVGCSVGAAGLMRLMQAWPLRWAVTLWLVAMPLLLLVCVGILVYTLQLWTAVSVVVAAAGVIAVYWGVSAAALRRRDLRMFQAAALGMFVPVVLALGFGLPRLDEVWISREIATKLHYLDPGARLPIAAVGSDDDFGIVGFHEDSLIFETRGRVQRIWPWELNEWFAANPQGLAVVPASMMVRQKDYIPIASIEGFNYSKGRLTYLCIAAVHP